MLGTLTEEQIAHVLRSQIIGRLGCNNGSAMYIVPVTYVYYEGHIYAHAKEGMKVKLMRENPHVCLQVDEIDNMANWRSVIVWGEYEELRNAKEQEEGMKIMHDRLGPYQTSETVSPSARITQGADFLQKGLKTVAYRIKVTKKSGRFEKGGY